MTTPTHPPDTLPEDLQRPLRVLDILLLAQTIMLAALAYLLSTPTQPNRLLHSLLIAEPAEPWRASGIFFAAAALLAFIATLLFARRHSWGWHIALFLQTILLSVGLFIYFFTPPNSDAPPFIYIVLAVAAFITFYLNIFGARFMFTQPAER
ncbi:hypothetical protein ARMA_0746 [Ardenticatena maritima]|uniref:Uncharacterized protein n=1 Tax=Ardenticatena maritima TaxID=872965 RepID=A0A0M8K5S2_9CHLR|nr:hypothetical protein [Ardenticatena maritima]KPL87311.1 hypothetical protein SE16_12555 [Ardenticatena maritima]GAP62323.1 hypothetical protein ARMA_0746 [Ardenticatena maritima]